MSPRPPSFTALLGDRRIIAVVRHGDAAVAEQIARQAVAGGLRAVEITTSVPGAAALVETLRASFPPDVCVGAGTVLSLRQLDEVVAAGAEFVVTPGLDRTLVRRCADRRVALLAGVLTPTEVMAARALALDAVKLFPAEAVGTGHLRALRSVFADVAFVPTGGVSSANAADWLSAGAYALGLSSEFDRAHNAGGGEGVRRLARHLCASFESPSSRRSPTGATT